MLIETLLILFAIMLSGLIAAQRPLTSAHAALFVSMILATFWAIGVGLAVNGMTGDEVWFARLVFASGLGAIVAVGWFTREITGSVRQRVAPAKLMWLWTGAAVAVMLLATTTPLVIKGMRLDHATVSLPLYGVLGWLFFAGVGVAAAGTAYVVYRAMRMTKGKRHQQARTVSVTVVSSVLLALMTNLVLPTMLDDAASAQLFYVSVLVLFGGLTYAIVRRRLFAVRLAAVRTLAYIISLGVIASIYYGMAYFVSVVFFQGAATTGVGMSPANVLLALALAFIFQPVKQLFDRATDRIFFRNRYDIDEFISRLGEILTSTTHLKTLLERTADELRVALKVSSVTFMVYRDGKEDVVVGAGRLKHFTPQEFKLIGATAEALNGEVLVVDEMAEADIRRRDVRGVSLKLLQRHHVALLVPLSGQVGYLLLGDALSGGYTQRDIKMLNAISNELAIAIQHARSVQEVRELNTHLQQRIDHATQELRESNSKLVRLDETKDEFISMASHQLRTPLTSIKGYLSMVLEGDAGAINAAQRKALGEAYTSSERMVRLISDFLNVSRLQTGKFIIDSQPTDLSKVIAQEVEAMRQLAESHDIMIAYKQPARFPILEVDEDKLRQVIMNFVDNAIYYSRSKSTIVVKAYVEHGDAVVEVHDQGIGVPQAEQDKLFTKFFRAENARRQRPDGTGVGLFLARKVVTALGGKVIFSSRQGKGSMFGFRLPIKKLKANT